MKVTRYDYASQFGDIDHLVKDLYVMLTEGRYILTDDVRHFEEAFGTYLGGVHVSGVGTGTDALVLALMALGVGRGDEVITHANTFYATVAAIRLVGAVPVLVDANESTFLIDESQVMDALTPRTRVVLPVHLYGKPTPLASLTAAARSRGFDILEDAAQAHGARIGGWSAGTVGRIGCFSFHPSKNLAAAGDGGAVVTRDAALAADVRRRRDLGQEGQGNHVVLGLNSKLDAIQARILSGKLPHLSEWNASRQWLARWYRERLSDLPLTFQEVGPDEEHAYHLFQIRTERRDDLLQALRVAGIDAVIRYPYPIHHQPAFQDCGWRVGQFPIAECLAKQLLCLPIRPNLSVDELDYVCDHVRRFFG